MPITVSERLSVQSKRSFRQFYEEQQGVAVANAMAVFLLVQFVMNAEARHFDIQNPFGLPGSLAQFIFYGVGIGLVAVLNRKRGFTMPLSPLAGVLWVGGLTLAAVFSVKPREAYPLTISVALYLMAGYGIWKASTNDRTLSYALKLMALVGIGWSIFIMKVFVEYGYLPIEYRARFSTIKNSYDHTWYGLLIINGAIGLAVFLIQKKGWFYKSFLAAFISFTFFVIFVSQCRSSLLAFASSCTYLLLKSEDITKRGQTIIKWSWVLLTIVFVVLSAKETTEQNEEMMKRFDFTDIEYQMRKSSGRPEMIKKGLILIARHPLGVGGYNARFTDVGIAEVSRIEGFVLHNQYLTAVAEGGWVVIISIVMLIKTTIVKPFKWTWKNPVRLGIFCCWINCTIVAVLADILSGYYILILFMALAAISLEMKNRDTA